MLRDFRRLGFVGLVFWAASAVAQPAFLEVNPRHTSPAFQQYVGRALDVMRRKTSTISQHTLISIRQGYVRIDELADLTYPDFLQLLRDFRGYRDPLGLTARDYADLQRSGSRALRIVRGKLDGYQLGNRVYVAGGATPTNLAATLVHEVNHVLNRSDENYSDHRQAYMEEYRAFYAESIFRDHDVTDPAVCFRIKRHVQDYYDFPGVDISRMPDRPPGRLIPTRANWNAAAAPAPRKQMNDVEAWR